MSQISFVDLKSQYRRIQDDVNARMQAVLEHGQFILGPEVRDLETALADYAGVTHAVGVSNGTDALVMTLMAAGIGPGDGVLVPAFTFTASAEVALLVGAEPIFVDINEDDFNININDLKDKIEEDSRVKPKAVIAVDLFGLPADYAALREICAANDLLLIADAAQSFGGAQAESKVGSLAPVSTTSFFPTKPLGCYGDGGAIFTDDDGMAEVLRSIRMHGQGASRYEIARIGLNGRLDSLQAAVLLAKLPILDDEIAARDRLAAYYDDRLGGIAKTPTRRNRDVCAWAQYSILLENRDQVMQALQADGIACQIYYPEPMHLQAPYRAYGGGEGSLPVSEKVGRHILSLPMHPYMDEADAARVADAVIAAAG